VRATLHCLVDALPEGELAAAQRLLDARSSDQFEIGAGIGDVDMLVIHRWQADKRHYWCRHSISKWLLETALRTLPASSHPGRGTYDQA